jgi:hypothetical protein
MKPKSAVPGTLYCWTYPKDKRYEEIYFGVTESTYKVIASSGNHYFDPAATSLGHEFRYENLLHDDFYKIITRRDLPLYMNLHMDPTFMKIMKGEKV